MARKAPKTGDVVRSYKTLPTFGVGYLVAFVVVRGDSLIYSVVCAALREGHSGRVCSPRFCGGFVLCKLALI